MVYSDSLDSSVDIRPTIAITKAHMKVSCTSGIQARG